MSFPQQVQCTAAKRLKYTPALIGALRASTPFRSTRPGAQRGARSRRRQRDRAAALPRSVAAARGRAGDVTAGAAPRGSYAGSVPPPETRGLRAYFRPSPSTRGLRRGGEFGSVCFPEITKQMTVQCCVGEGRAVPAWCVRPEPLGRGCKACEQRCDAAGETCSCCGSAPPGDWVAGYGGCGCL